MRRDGGFGFGEVGDDGLKHPPVGCPRHAGHFEDAGAGGKVPEVQRLCRIAQGVRFTAESREIPFTGLADFQRAHERGATGRHIVEEGCIQACQKAFVSGEVGEGRLCVVYRQGVVSCCCDATVDRGATGGG